MAQWTKFVLKGHSSFSELQIPKHQVPIEVGHTDILRELKKCLVKTY